MEKENISYSQQAIDIGIRMVLLFGILFWCFQIVSPFIMPVLWGLIIAIAVSPIQDFFETKFKMGSSLASIVITILLLSIILVPTALFFTSTTHTIMELKVRFDTEGFSMPEPPKFVYDIPVIGEKLHVIMNTFNKSLEDFFNTYQTKLLALGKIVIGAVIDTGMGILQILVSIILAGIFLKIGDQKGVSEELFNRLVGKDGQTYVRLIVQTIRSVVKGVLGVAVIQTALVALGIYICGIPNGSIWVLLCLILSIVQVGPGIVLIGIVAYLFQTESHLYAGLWTAYFFLCTLADNILKPFLLGNDANVPMIVIFIGVVGGFMYSGFIGLFLGAIVLSICYTLFQFWIEPKVGKKLEESAIVD
ncbi:MAG: AI-2E family transporter [bacterium]|nr:AI-2E family transporter [bacterium]